MRRRVRASFMVAAFILFTSSLVAQAQAMIHFDIQAQPLADSLRAVGTQAHTNILFDPPLVAGRKAPAIQADLTINQALARLLAGTGIRYEFINETTVVLAAQVSTQSAPASSPPTSDQNSPARNDEPKEGKKSSSEGFRVAQVDQTPAGPKVTQPAQQPTQGVALQEIIVTAQKREEKLIDVPQSVTVLTGDELAKMGATQLMDWGNAVPGMSFQTLGSGNQNSIVLRGVTTGADFGPSVAVYVDEVPFSVSSQIDVGLFDVDRIEVLLGPQGTLYGSSAMGGLVKYVSVEPDTARGSGYIRSGVSALDHGDLGFLIAAGGNVPIVTDSVALRASGFESHAGGYVDNLALNEKGINSSDIYGGRLDLLLTPSSDFTVRLTGFLQNITNTGNSTVEYTLAGVPQYGDLKQFRLVKEPFNQSFRLGSATLTYDFGRARLTSVTSYQDSEQRSKNDITPGYAQFCPLQGSTCSAVGNVNISSTHKFTQELRLSQEGSLFGWVLGGFYTHESDPAAEYFELYDQSAQPIPNNLFTFYQPSTYDEYAAFGDLTWHLTSQLDLTGGVRSAHDKVANQQFGSGLFVGNGPALESKQSVTTYLADARYHFNPDLMTYFRFATGYRPGGPNAQASDPVTGLPLGPAEYRSDSLKSYEIGFKAETSNRRLGANLALYDIDWSKLQIQSSNNGFFFRTNAQGGATINGAELTLSARPVDRLTMQAALAYQHAYLKEAEPDLGGAAGERLPNVPRGTGSFSADYSFGSQGLMPTIGAQVRYVSDRTTSFNSPPAQPQYRLPAYTVIDLHGSVVVNSVSVQLYVRNALDERGQISVVFPQFGNRVAIIPPATVGLSASKEF